MEHLESLSFVGLLTLLLLLGCSLLVVTIGLERHSALKRGEQAAQWWQAQLYYFLKDRRTADCLNFVQQLAGPTAQVCRIGLHRAHLTVEETETAMMSEIARQKRALEGHLSTVGTVAVVAPFIGLFGTVVGIMNTFSAVAEMGQAGIEVVSAGVAEALVATAAGLFVAISAVVLFNGFKARIHKIVLQMQQVALQLSEMLELNRSERPFPQDLKLESGEAAELFDKTQGKKA